MIGSIIGIDCREEGIKKEKKKRKRISIKGRGEGVSVKKREIEGYE